VSAHEQAGLSSRSSGPVSPFGPRDLQDLLPLDLRLAEFLGLESRERLIDTAQLLDGIFILRRL